MSFLLPIRLAFPTCPRALWSGRTRDYRPATTMANYALLTADMPARIGLRLRRAFVANVPMRTLLGSLSAVTYPVLYSSPLRGFAGAPAHSVFCFAFSPQQANTALSRDPDLRALQGLGSSETSLQSAAQNAAQTSFGPSRKQTFVLGAGPSLGFAQCDRATTGNSTNGDTIMYQNKVTLIGFLGSNPEARTNSAESASQPSRWRPSPPTRRMASTSRTPNGIVA